ncbi:MAG: hypothetical protein ACYTDY_00990 [Planctomycetota bacterium]|jgi:hypothetical protein
MANSHLEKLLSRLPELVDLTQRIPAVEERLQRAFDEKAEPRWRADDRAYMTLVLYVAGTVEMIEDLTERIEQLEEARAEIQSKADLVRAAEHNWKAIASTRDGVVFSNSPGDTVTLPRDFLAVFVTRHQLDVSEIVEDGMNIVVRDGEEVVTVIPKSLWLVLGSVMEQCPWFPGQA